MVSLQLGLSEQQRVVRGRERALDSTQKSMEALVRSRQEEIEGRRREVRRHTSSRKRRLSLFARRLSLLCPWCLLQAAAEAERAGGACTPQIVFGLVTVCIFLVLQPSYTA